MGTNCAPLVADLFLFCYDSDFTTAGDWDSVEAVERLPALH